MQSREFKQSDWLRVSEAAAIVDALNQALSQPLSQARARVLLEHVQSTTARKSLALVMQFDDLHRTPGPRLTQLIQHDPITGTSDLPDPAEHQQILDQLATMHGPFRPPQPRACQPVIEASAVEGGWFRDGFGAYVSARQLQDHRVVDALAGAWVSAPDRMVVLVLTRTAEQTPYDDQDRARISLLLPALATALDDRVSMHDSPASEGSLPPELAEVTPRQREVLALLLQGESEPSIARLLYRSVNTVHTHVKELYRHLGVKTRGELLAMFVDRTLIERLQVEKSGDQEEN